MVFNHPFRGAKRDSDTLYGEWMKILALAVLTVLMVVQFVPGQAGPAEAWYTTPTPKPTEKPYPTHTPTPRPTSTPRPTYVPTRTPTWTPVPTARPTMTLSAPTEQPFTPTSVLGLPTSTPPTVAHDAIVVTSPLPVPVSPRYSPPQGSSLDHYCSWDGQEYTLRATTNLEHVLQVAPNAPDKAHPDKRMENGICTQPTAATASKSAPTTAPTATSTVLITTPSSVSTLPTVTLVIPTAPPASPTPQPSSEPTVRPTPEPTDLPAEWIVPQQDTPLPPCSSGRVPCGSKG